MPSQRAKDLRDEAWAGWRMVGHRLVSPHGEWIAPLTLHCSLHSRAANQLRNSGPPVSDDRPPQRHHPAFSIDRYFDSGQPRAACIRGFSSRNRMRLSAWRQSPCGLTTDCARRAGISACRCRQGARGTRTRRGPAAPADFVPRVGPGSAVAPARSGTIERSVTWADMASADSWSRPWKHTCKASAREPCLRAAE